MIQNQSFLGSSPRFPTNARVAKLVDALDLGSSAARREGSTPFSRTGNFFDALESIQDYLDQGWIIDWKDAQYPTKE